MSVSNKNFPGFEYNAGIGYVIWPRDIPREEYVKKSLTDYTISIAMEDGGVRNRVPFIKSCVDDIEFPLANNEYGSIVFWVLSQKTKQVVIIGVFKPHQTVGDLVENFFKWRREYRGSFVEISGSPKDRVLNTVLNVDQGGTYNVVVKNKKQEKALMNVEVTGNINMLSTQDTQLKQYGQYSITTSKLDNRDIYSKYSQTASEQQFITDKVVFNKREGDGVEEAIVLGETFKRLFDNFIEEVSRTTVTTAMGQMPILNAAQVAAFKERTQEILSELTFSE